MNQDFDSIYREIAPGVLRYLRRFMGSRLQAEDVLQETFLTLHVQLGEGLKVENPRAWLFHVATNLAKNKRRDAIRAALREERYGARARIVDIHSRLESQETVRQVLARLSPRMRQSLLLFSEGFSYREIAQVAEIEVTNVGSLLRRARETFRELFEEQQHGRERDKHKQRRSL
ncbi:MAG: sigma-70 family RNA polymerase sigma factor [Acidobacteriota bacterium]